MQRQYVQPCIVQPQATKIRTRESRSNEECRRRRACSSQMILAHRFVPKNDKSLRVCVDCRLLNSATLRDSYTIQRTAECIYSLVETMLLSTMAASSG